MSEHMVIFTKEGAEHVEQDILKMLEGYPRTKKEWDDTEQMVSRYVFATMPDELVLRAIEFTITHFSYYEFPLIGKIIVSRVIREPALLAQPIVSKFLEECLNKLAGHYGYLGYDTWGNYYTMNDWHIAKRALTLILRERAVSFLPQVKRICDAVAVNNPTLYPADSIDGDLIHAGICGSLKFVVQELRRNQ
ncbi:MAG: hypothetical protein Q8R40_00775 [bacterium]|nr:hypothetical protein [bacterium]